MASALEDFPKTNTESSRFLVGLIADYETTIGFLLAGIGEFLDSNKKFRNFMLVNEETPKDEIETFFQNLCGAKRIGVILISTEVYKSLNEIIQLRQKAVPIIIEIPSRKSLEHNPEKHE